ncbi:Eco57I restriction-modification methylase domain-containing protein, partial [Methylovulum psychrotolerans]
MSRNPLLTDVYYKLDLMSGRLLDACHLPTAADEDTWLNNGGWLELANKIGAEKIFFVKDEPVIVFQQLDTMPSDAQLTDIIRKAWCMSRPQRLFLALPTELRVYDLTSQPVDETGRQAASPLATVRSAAEILEKLQAYRREQLESGYLCVPEKRFGHRADKQLIDDLKRVRTALEKAGLPLEYAHALISRAIFIRYLEDRKILTQAYFKGVAGNDVERRNLLATELEKSAVIAEDKAYFFYQVLQDKAFTYALFDKLAEDFNGDLFPRDDLEKEYVEQRHLTLLRGFLLGDTDQQQNLFFWLYDFEIVPIELISHIYEEFYHTTKAADSKGSGSHYTPSALSEFVLSEVLTYERLQTNPTVLDPACGSGIFLVEAFRRIVRFKMQQAERSLTALELRAVLRDQIRGIELNKNAVDISAFSLYLALLHYQEPKDILAQIAQGASSDKPLPHLIYNRDKGEVADYCNILFCCNAFDLMDVERQMLEERLKSTKNIEGLSEIKKLLDNKIKLPIEPGSIDVIVGNPPWGRGKKDSIEILWCIAFNWSIGGYELSQAFIARSLSLLREKTGESALLISEGVFFKVGKNSQIFRQKWLNETTINKVVNFAHVRKIFFRKANSPFAFVRYQKKPASFSHRIRYWSAKKLETVKNNQSIVLYNADIRQIRQHDVANDEILWKIYWWGGHRDAS